jgi:hypothetical protein
MKVPSFFSTIVYDKTKLELNLMDWLSKENP